MSEEQKMGLEDTLTIGNFNLKFSVREESVEIKQVDKYQDAPIGVTVEGVTYYFYLPINIHRGKQDD